MYTYWRPSLLTFSVFMVLTFWRPKNRVKLRIMREISHIPKTWVVIFGEEDNDKSSWEIREKVKTLMRDPHKICFYLGLLGQHLMTDEGGSAFIKVNIVNILKLWNVGLLLFRLTWLTSFDCSMWVCFYFV